jgi:hypothetical protein
LIRREGVAVGVETYGPPLINGRAARDQGMGLGPPAVEGQGRIEDVREPDPWGRYHVRGARAEARHPGGAVIAKELVVGSKNRTPVINLTTPVVTDVARHQRVG